MHKVSRFSLSLLLAIGLIACSSSAKKQAKRDKVELEPTSTDSLQPLMAKTQANLRYLIYGVMNFDPHKVEKSVKNLITITQYTAKNTQFAKRGNKADWQAHCDDQQAAVENIRRLFVEKEYDQIGAQFGNLVDACIKCHAPYRKFAAH